MRKELDLSAWLYRHYEADWRERLGSPGGRSGPWPLALTLAVLIGLAVALLLGCAAARVPTMVQTDEARCQDRGGYWTEVEGTWHCLARRP